MDRLQSMSVFKHVVAENGFAAGGRKLGLSPAQVTRTVQDLEDHLGGAAASTRRKPCGITAFVRFVLPGVASHALRLLDSTDGTREQRVDLQPVLICNDHEAALRSTLKGAGISSQAMPVATPLLRSGQLQRVPRAWIAERCTLVATFAGHRHMPGRMRAFLDHLLEHARHARADTDSPRTPAPTSPK